MTIQAMAGEPLVFPTADGIDLQGVLYRPQGQARRAVLISDGLGIPQRFYAPFATWLAERGHLVLTFDLRGVGASRGPRHRRSLRGLDADMLTWSRALDAVPGRAPAHTLAGLLSRQGASHGG